MNNNFMLKLARHLLFSVSYREMKDIIEDYWGFANEHSLSEDPKQILLSVHESKNRLYITCAILTMYIMVNIYLFILISEHDYFSSSLRFLLLFFMSLLFSSLAFIFFSRKVILMSKFCKFKKYEKILIPLLILVFF